MRRFLAARLGRIPCYNVCDVSDTFYHGQMYHSDMLISKKEAKLEKLTLKYGMVTVASIRATRA
jgi:hypothetical protein